MIGFTLARAPQIVTCLGAHPDDIEIGVGGTLLHLAARHPEVRFRFLVMTGTEERRAEAQTSASALLGDRVEVRFGGFEENTLPYANPVAAKSFVHDQGGAVATDLVFAPQRSDLHQDHRFVAEVALQAFRDHPILGYEIPKYDGGQVDPNLFVPLSESDVNAKLDHLDSNFSSQHQKPWYGRELFAAAMRIRGMEARAESGYAEGFTAVKVTLR